MPTNNKSHSSFEQSVGGKRDHSRARGLDGRHRVLALSPLACFGANRRGDIYEDQAARQATQSMPAFSRMALSYAFRALFQPKYTRDPSHTQTESLMKRCQS
eukprot:3947877-Amphidinium_carterae.1